jgi:hypothetical protein
MQCTSLDTKVDYGVLDFTPHNPPYMPTVYTKISSTTPKAVANSSIKWYKRLHRDSKPLLNVTTVLAPLD